MDFWRVAASRSGHLFRLAALPACTATSLAYRVLDRVLHDGAIVNLRLPLSRITSAARMDISANALVSHGLLWDSVGTVAGGGVAGIGDKRANASHFPFYKHWYRRGSTAISAWKVRRCQSFAFVARCHTQVARKKIFGRGPRQPA